jgi:hypothetical protein
MWGGREWPFSPLLDDASNIGLPTLNFELIGGRVVSARWVY